MPYAKLIIRLRGQVEQEKELAAGISIGSALDNSFRILDPDIARYHASIDLRDNNFWLNDLGSQAGTTLNGVRVTSAHKLADGDLISFGSPGSLEFRLDQAQDQGMP